jgi:4a-hydroxytetrahydrobiopterin dehydratase
MSIEARQQPRFSAGSDAAALEASLSPLLAANGGRWNLTKEGEALEREFKFKTFAKTWVNNNYMATIKIHI